MKLQILMLCGSNLPRRPSLLMGECQAFLNDKHDIAPMVWSYIKSRETARRIDAYAGEDTSMDPHFAFDSPLVLKIWI